MALGQLKEFSFHAYWMPSDEVVQLRQIGNLRPPNELMTEALRVLDEQDVEYVSMSDEYPVYIGVVTVAFVYVAGEPEENQIASGATDFENRLRVEKGVLVGDEVAGEYRRRHADGSLVYSDNPDNEYAPYQDKGWLAVTGEYYTPSDSKPDGWSSQ